jgi:hypothetical protein
MSNRFFTAYGRPASGGSIRRGTAGVDGIGLGAGPGRGAFREGVDAGVAGLDARQRVFAHLAGAALARDDAAQDFQRLHGASSAGKGAGR